MFILTESQRVSYAWVCARATARQSERPVRACFGEGMRCAWAAYKADTAKAKLEERRAADAARLLRQRRDEFDGLLAGQDTAARVRRSHWRPLGEHLTVRI